MGKSGPRQLLRQRPGNLAKSPHVVRADVKPGELPVRSVNRGRRSGGGTRERAARGSPWQVTVWPIAVVYEGLPEDGSYVVQSTGYGQALLRINGERVTPSLDGREIGEKKEFPVDPKFLKERQARAHVGPSGG